jgi:DNA-directed RNA polymerase specialized sigma24 family protein
MRDSNCANFRWTSDCVREAYWASIVQLLAPRLRRYIATSKCSADEREEIIWDVLAELASHEAELVSSESPWEVVLPLVRKQCAQFVNRRRRELPATHNAFESAHADETAVEEQYVARLTNWTNIALLSIPPKQRTALCLHVLEGRTYQEVAFAMRSSEGAARFNVHAALKRLRAIVSSYPPPREDT